MVIFSIEGEFLITIFDGWSANQFYLFVSILTRPVKTLSNILTQTSLEQLNPKLDT